MWGKFNCRGIERRTVFFWRGSSKDRLEETVRCMNCGGATSLHVIIKRPATTFFPQIVATKLIFQRDLVKRVFCWDPRYEKQSRVILLWVGFLMAFSRYLTFTSRNIFPKFIPMCWRLGRGYWWPRTVFQRLNTSFPNMENFSSQHAHALDLRKKNLVRLADLHQPTWKKDSTWWNHSKNPSKLKNVVDSKYSTKVTQASCSNFSPCAVPEVVWIGRYSGESQTPRS